MEPAALLQIKLAYILGCKGTLYPAVMLDFKDEVVILFPCCQPSGGFSAEIFFLAKRLDNTKGPVGCWGLPAVASRVELPQRILRRRMECAVAAHQRHLRTSGRLFKPSLNKTILGRQGGVKEKGTSPTCLFETVSATNV